jgi:hypothetical protein
MAIAQYPIYREVLEFLVSSPTPEEIIAFRPSEATQQRAYELLTANREDRLTLEERAEIEEFARTNHFMSMLKIQARKKLAGQ